jgi:LmbE family N-acetylglucosaminyl deacetylase
MARTVLAIVAHPDDCELTCAGAVARWVREGDRAILVVATDGARGGKLPGSVADRVARERREEQQAAADVLGVADVVFLGFPDGELQDDERLRGALVEQIRRFKPDVVVIPDPLTVIYHNFYVNHRDHRMLGMAALDAMYPEASNAGYFPEQLDGGLQIHKVPEVLLAQTDSPNHWVDVSETLELRFDALRRHRSQIALWPENGEAVVRQQREMAELIGLEHGVRYAEEYRRVVVNPLA